MDDPLFPDAYSYHERDDCPGPSSGGELVRRFVSSLIGKDVREVDTDCINNNKLFVLFTADK
jgi:hypothetical protein